MNHELDMTVNGTPVRLSVDPRTTLADVLRHRLGLTGTHLGCEHGVCGACTVLVDAAAVRSCLLFAVQADGCQIVTVEGLGTPENLHPLQRAFGEHHGLQCGFCTPGFLMSAYEALREPDQLTDPGSTAEALSGVLCRCTGYRGIVAAVSELAGTYPDGLPPPGNLGVPLDVAGAPPRTAEEPADEAGPEPLPGTLDLSVPRGDATADVSVDSVVAAPVDAVWSLVTDVPRVSECLPGAELTGRSPEGDYRGRIQVRVGPMAMRFEGAVRIVEINEDARRMELVGAGRDRRGGSARAHITFTTVAAGEEGSRLQARARLFLTGRMVQFGRSIIADVGQQLFEQFARNLQDYVRTGSPVAGGMSPLRMIAAGLVAWVRRSLAGLRNR